ncbi:V-type ATPase assembly factor PKR1 [Candida viswanathii]|uniref:V-type ATPase assembly factor PKR1 n=1 Tax=Candida viswanathii TaxID=5486 RepID=A0A367Y1B4_9ASCO|nr:V-type ATPase assembly factor PKR1 [Candida viswanathii]
MSFFVELWESVFTPGTTPALITATHASFILLIISLITLIYLTKSIHFFNLLVIAVLLYGTVFWFINELQKVKLQSNEELANKNGDTKKEAETTEDTPTTAESTSVPDSNKVKKRKA